MLSQCPLIPHNTAVLIIILCISRVCCYDVIRAMLDVTCLDFFRKAIIR